MRSTDTIPKYGIATKNEYGAYRWLYYHAVVEKTAVNGCRAEFTVTRAEPAFIGASVPMYLVFSSLPKVCERIPVDADSFGVLPDTPGHGVPDLVDKTELDKESVKFPGISCGIIPITENRIKVYVQNQSHEDLERVVFSFITPPEYACGVLCASADRVVTGRIFTTTFELGERSKSDLYKRDRIAFQLRTDFAKNGRNGRIYSSFQIPYSVEQPDCVPRDQILVLGPVTANELAGFSDRSSTPDRPLQNAGRELRLRWRSVMQEGWMPWVFNPLASMPQEVFKKIQRYPFTQEDFDEYLKQIQPYYSDPDGEFFCALDFDAQKHEEVLLDLPFNLMISFFVDGTPYNPKKDTMKIHCGTGKHRLILHMKTKSAWAYFPNGYFCGIRFEDTNELVCCSDPGVESQNINS